MGSDGGDGGLHDPRVGHDGLRQAGDDVAGVGVGQDLGLRHEAGEVHLTGAANRKTINAMYEDDLRSQPHLVWEWFIRLRLMTGLLLQWPFSWLLLTARFTLVSLSTA